MPNNKLRDLLMKRTHWMGYQARETAETLTEIIKTFVKVADVKDGAMTYTVEAGPDRATIEGMHFVRHVVVTVDKDRVFCQLCLDRGDTIMIDFEGASPYNPVDLRRPMKVSKQLVKAAKRANRD